MSRRNGASGRPRRPVRDAVSAGGIVYRRTGDAMEIVLVARPEEGLWALPKGTPDPGESIEETARREVLEETGLEVEIVERLGEVRYWYTEADGGRVRKVVHYFLMRPTGGRLEDHDHEFDVADWFDVHEAEKRLTHRNQLFLLTRAADRVATMPA